jgi:peptidoglycan/xylan/chitin deacetylase (PgdA/CDA1 family)
MAKFSESLEYIARVYGLKRGTTNLLRVITYHRVGVPGEIPHLDPRQISATPEMFEQQMKFLKNHYTVVHMEQVMDAAINGRSLPKGAVAVTFDDAYEDVKKYAWPILKKYDLPATVFVPTAYPDQPDRSFWWDRLYNAFVNTSREEVPSTPIGKLSLRTPEERLQNLKQLQNHIKILSHGEMMEAVEDVCGQLLNGENGSLNDVIGWEELRRLVKEGLTLGGHTRTHPILTQVSLEQVREEVRGSLEDLRREIGEVLPVFAYPNGNHTEMIMKILHDEGYKLAFITRGGFNDMNLCQPFAIHRINITRRTDLGMFRLRLMRWFSSIDMQRH